VWNSGRRYIEEDKNVPRSVGHRTVQLYISGGGKIQNARTFFIRMKLQYCGTGLCYERFLGGYGTKRKIETSGIRKSSTMMLFTSALGISNG
jgi:hypothetical protein